MQAIGDNARPVLANPAMTALDLDRNVSTSLRDPSFPTDAFGVPLAASLIPWIDKAVEGGMSREEWKGHVEANKILGKHNGSEVMLDGICVRVGAMRCHSQALTIKLRRDLPLSEIEGLIAGGNEWVRVVPNERQASLEALTTSPSLKAGAFFAGDAPGMFEAFLVPQMYAARRFGVDVASHPRIVEIDARCASIEAFALAHPDRQPDAPRPAS